jgi:hypothetical protein
MIFNKLLWFSKYLVKINKKEKDKIVFKTTHNQARDVIWTVSKIEGYALCSYEVYGRKLDFRGNLTGFKLTRAC